MAFGVDVDSGALGMPPESERHVLMCHPRQWYALADVCIEMDDSFRAIRMFQQALELRPQTPVAFFIIWLVGQLDLAVLAHCHPVVRIGQILRCHPEVQRVFGHKIQGKSWNNLRRPGGENVRVGLTDERYVAHREIPLFGWEVKIVQAESLLKDS